MVRMLAVLTAEPIGMMALSVTSIVSKGTTAAVSTCPIITLLGTQVDVICLDDFFYVRSSPEINDYVFETIAWDNAQVSIRPRSFGEPSLFYNEEGVLLSMGTYFTTYYSTVLLDGKRASEPIFSKEPKGQSFELQIGWASE